MSTNNFQPDGLPDIAVLEKLANQFFHTLQPEQGVLPSDYTSPVLSQDPLLQQGSVADYTHAPTSLPDPHFSGEPGIPVSVAGSGISPAAIRQFEHPVALNASFEQELQRALAAIRSPHFSSQLPVQEMTYYFLPGQTVAAPASGVPPLDINQIRADFPILQQQVNGRRLIWLDNAATTQKPQHVIDRISYFYKHENSNIHRAAHELAARATDAYEGAREKVKHFLHAASVNEIVFVRGATEAINLVAQSWGEQYLQAGDEIILSHLEHHANIVPWQQLAARKGLVIKVIPVDDDGQILLDEYARLLGPKTKLVSFTQVSNALGTVTPAKKMVEMAHQAGAKVLVDGAQAVSHLRADVQYLDCDWYVFSGHKVFGPTGIGVLYGKEALLNETQPWQGGGNMIKDVTFEHTQYHAAPGRFEAGTGNIADAVGLGAAIDYVNHIGIDLIHQYEHYLLQYATQLLKDIPGLRLIGTAPDKTSVLSFIFKDFTTEQVGAALNQEGIAVRSGHHCAQPILRRFGVESTVRPSLAFYNSCSDVDTLVEALLRLRRSKI
ncbi:family 2A encapsulin nanocompartment cargo protein cysteine desulfurase [Chitinophaga nivalis]|nr:family 2A encapsulin nanocompartment cargo protein cysteine desulfurase [Chitinophaga nivalis]